MDRAERLAFAKAYPFARPPFSFVLAGDRALELMRPLPKRLADAAVRARGVVVRLADYCRREGLDAPVPFSERTAVIAYGSNAAPERLRQKFGPRELIPVLRATLAQFDVVFAPHFARYGSIPATLEPSPGTRVEVFITYVTASQLETMDASEVAAVQSHYARGLLRGIGLDLEADGRLDQAEVYAAKRGALRLDGAARAFATIGARARRLRAHTQEEMLDLVRRSLAPEEELDDFLDGTIGDERRRAHWNELLRTQAANRALPGFEVRAG